MEALENFGADGLFGHIVAEFPGDLVVDIGLQQRAANVAHRVLDVLLGNSPAPGHLAEHVGEFFRKRLKHNASRITDSPAQRK